MPRHFQILATLGVCLWPLSVANAQVVVARVVRVIDGDTLDVVAADGTTARIRLAGIDAPEADQPYGLLSASLLATLQGKTVSVNPSGRDAFGRLVAEVYFGDVWVNRAMVESGLAWSESRQLNQLQVLAAQKKRGLWFLSNPIAPAAWRQLNAQQKEQVKGQAIAEYETLARNTRSATKVDGNSAFKFFFQAGRNPAINSPWLYPPPYATGW